MVIEQVRLVEKGGRPVISKWVSTKESRHDQGSVFAQVRAGRLRRAGPALRLRQVPEHCAALSERGDKWALALESGKLWWRSTRPGAPGYPHP